VISLTDVKKEYRMGEMLVRALNGVTLSISAGEYVAIMGPSGSGKSTLMHLIGLLDTPTSGSYSFGGKEILGMKEEDLARIRSQEIGFVFQQFNLLPRTSARENVGLPLIYRGQIPDLEKSANLLRRVGLGERLDHKPNELSGGQQQRVAIARSLINDPRLILADEPTGNLDSKSTEEILDLFSELNGHGITVVMVTHEEDVARRAKRVIRMLDGKVQSDTGGTKALKDHVIVERKPVPVTWQSWFRTLMIHCKQAMKALSANKVRSGLSVLGILIGVAAVIAMLALGSGAKKSLEEQLSSLGSNLLVLAPGSPRSFGVQLDPGSVTRFRVEDGQEIARSVRGVKSTASIVNGRVRVAFGNKNWSSSLTGSQPEYAEMHNAPAVQGRFFTHEEDLSRARVAVLGKTVVKELFEDRNPIGETIRINKVAFTVIGVAKERGATGFRDQDDIVLVPLNTAMRRLLGKDYVDMIDIEVRSAEEMPGVDEDIRTLMIRRHRLPPSMEDSFSIRNLAEIQEALGATSRIMSALLASIAAISLLVGGIGIMNIMLVSVTERTREIGLRKAIGARREDILTQFLVESSLVGLTGGTIGIALGALITFGISYFAGWATFISLSSVLLAFFFSAGIGVLFGLWPAKKAAALSPIEALRHE